MNTRGKGWCVTVNNPTEADKKAFAEIGAKYWIYGEEVGEEGTPHLQGYIWFQNQRTFRSVTKKLPRAHIEKAKGSPQQNITYCSKDGNITEGGIRPIGAVGKKCTFAERAERNKRLRELSLNELVETGEISISQVRHLKNARYDLAQETEAYTSEGVRGIWVYGPPGTGKSHWARTEYPGAYIKAQNKWFDGYVGEDTIILDDLDTSTLGHYIKIWADKWSCSGEVKGGKVHLRHSRFIITSNYHPDKLWADDPIMAQAISRRMEFKQFLIKHTN